MDSEILNLACLNNSILEMIISNHELLLTIFINTFNILLLFVITKNAIYHTFKTLLLIIHIKLLNSTSNDVNIYFVLNIEFIKY